MANKTLKKKVQAQPVISKLAAPVVESERDFWFAGLGAFSIAQQESGKLIGQGDKLFKKLVSEGTKLEKKSLGKAESAVDEVKSEFETKFEDMRQQTTDNLDALAQVFDKRVSAAVERLGVPTTKDLNSLSESVQKLSHEALENMGKLEGAVEKRVSEILGGLGIPGVDDTSKLVAELDRLSNKVKVLEAQLKDNGNTARRKPAAKKVVKASPTPEAPVKTVVVAEKSENTPTAA